MSLKQGFIQGRGTLGFPTPSLSSPLPPDILIYIIIMLINNDYEGYCMILQLAYVQNLITVNC